MGKERWERYEWEFGI